MKIEFNERLRASGDLDKQVYHLTNQIKNIYSLNNPIKPFTVIIDKGEKTTPQLRAFYEAITQLLPQYNATGHDYTKDEFKEILKSVGGWVGEKGEKQATIFVLNNFKKLKKELSPNLQAISKDDDLKKKFIEADSKTITPKSFTNIKKEDMSKVIDRIDRWAMKRGFTLSISKENQDLLK